MRKRELLVAILVCLSDENSRHWFITFDREFFA